MIQCRRSLNSFDLEKCHIHAFRNGGGRRRQREREAALGWLNWLGDSPEIVHDAGFHHPKSDGASSSTRLRSSTEGSKIYHIHLDGRELVVPKAGFEEEQISMWRPLRYQYMIESYKITLRLPRKGLWAQGNWSR